MEVRLVKEIGGQTAAKVALFIYEFRVLCFRLLAGAHERIRFQTTPA
jgi:hypothetical protein